jgi:SiaC family regulatory phosphoprotein
MENYKVEATENTPLIELDHNNHTLLFQGDSRPENVQQFYSHVIEWLDNYGKHLYFLKDLNNASIKIDCNFKFEYFNSSSAKYIMDIITMLSKFDNGVTLNINWYYEEMDEDMQEAGEEFEDMMGVKFNFIQL